MELPFFYEDHRHAFFIVPPSPVRLEWKGVHQMSTSMMIGGSNVMQDAVYVNPTPVAGYEDENVVSGDAYSRILDRNMIQNHYFGAGDAGQVIFRSSEGDSSPRSEERRVGRE